MNKKIFKQRLDGEVLIIDGAMGTMLQPHFPSGFCIDAAGLEKPDVVQGVQTEYVQAGADIILTNTLGGSSIKLNEFGLENKMKEINVVSAKLARKAAGSKAWVAGCIGPTGKLVEPMGPLGFDEAYETFKEQAIALAEGGVQLFILETFADLKEVKIAAMAVKENTDLPIMASMTFEDNFTSFTGTNPETAANVLSSLGVDAIGVNCSTGPEPMLEVIGRYAMISDLPIFVEPNAGIPRFENKSVIYHITPEEMAHFAELFVDIGANMVGTCCGSSPEYTSRLRQVIKNKKPISKHIESVLSLSSRIHTVHIGAGKPFCIIGERINPTNREDLVEALLQDKIGPLQKEAQQESKEGAHLLDVNIGTPGIDEARLMGKVIRGMENVTRLPLVIDTTNPHAIEAALKETSGKVLINSVHGSQESMDTIIPLAARYGTGLLCLAVGEKGIPKTSEERITVLKKIIEKTDAAGIPRRHLICDCLTLTVSAQQKRAETTLKAIRAVKEELGLPTVLGVSNISFGLPERSLINSTFLGMTMSAGLDAAIMNSGDSRMMDTIRAASVLTIRDKDSKAFVADFQKKTKKKAGKSPDVKLEEENIIQDAVLAGNREEIENLVQDALDKGRTAYEINSHMLIPAIQEVGRRYDIREIFLPQMILAAETMQKGFKVLEPHFAGEGIKSRGKILLCTVKGDVHDIGKNIVSLFLKNHGFEVIDLGKDVSTDIIVKNVVSENADMVGLSALMTTTMVEMPKVIDALHKEGVGTKVIVGGAVVTKKYASDIGADGFAKDGVEAVKTVMALLGH